MMMTIGKKVMISHIVSLGCKGYKALRVDCMDVYMQHRYIMQPLSDQICGAQQIPANFTDRDHEVKACRTHAGTVADTAAAKQTERVLQSVEPFGAGLIAAVQNEAQRL